MKNLRFVLLLGIVSFIISCQSGKRQEVTETKEAVNEFVTHLTSSDTLSVQTLVNQFMEYAKNGRLEEAASMLYKADTADVWNEPLQLDNDELHHVAQMLDFFPVLSYKVDYIKFYSAIKNEVKCTIVMREADGENPAVTNSWYFKPMNYLGGWRLCMMDSSSNDSPVK